MSLICSTPMLSACANAVYAVYDVHDLPLSNIRSTELVMLSLQAAVCLDAGLEVGIDAHTLMQNLTHVWIHV